MNVDPEWIIYRPPAARRPDATGPTSGLLADRVSIAEPALLAELQQALADMAAATSEDAYRAALSARDAALTRLLDGSAYAPTTAPVPPPAPRP